MTPAKIYIITEGLTEREVGRVLHEKSILSKQGTPRPPNWRSTIGSREGYEQVIRALAGSENPLLALQSSGGKVLLVFDQEKSGSPMERKNKIEHDLRTGDSAGFWANISFQRVSEYNNIFEHNANGLHIILHISNASVEGLEGGNFDGYILQILQGPHRVSVAQHFTPQSMSPEALLSKAEKELTELMQRNNFPWKHAKSWLYAYITAFQYNQSHVWFARDVVRHTPDEELCRVFASLIAAWERLISGGAP